MIKNLLTQSLFSQSIAMEEKTTLSSSPSSASSTPVSFSSKSSQDFQMQYESYPNVNLRYSAKKTYCHGKYATMTDKEWFNFVRSEYIAFIIRQYTTQNNFKNRIIYTHIITATNQIEMDTLFTNLYNVITKQNLNQNKYFK